MKNIHILPTEKPTWLHKSLISGVLRKSSSCIDDMKQAQGMNIYITSENEDINENDHIITKDGRLVQVSYLLSKDLEGASKVVLASNPDLIKDGVQAIDDEFLEWFVKNPSCEFVNINIEDMFDETYGEMKGNYYKIIIPKEEPKQETLEEAALKEAQLSYFGDEVDAYVRGSVFGAKWQQEQTKNMYSEEEVMDMFHNFSMHLPLHYEFLVREQFKKK
jgi:hypothetical protein